MVSLQCKYIVVVATMVSLQCKYVVVQFTVVSVQRRDIVTLFTSLTSFYYCFILDSFLQGNFNSVVRTTGNQSASAAVTEATLKKNSFGRYFWHVQ